MSLQTRISSLITAVGEDVKSIRSDIGLTFQWRGEFISDGVVTYRINDVVTYLGWWYQAKTAMTGLTGTQPASVGGLPTESTYWRPFAYQPPPNPGIVSVLPTSPINGQIIYFQSAGMATDGIVWKLRYRSQSASVYKWEFVGGASLESEIATDQSTTSTAYVALATAGPSITVPLAGDYDIEVGCRHYSSVAGAFYHSYDVGATAAVDADAMLSSASAAGQSFAGFRVRRKTAIAASAAIVSKYRVGSGNQQADNRWMRVTPRRLG